MDAAVIDETSAQFLGQWKRLVSTTNWDKGRIIQAWREVLSASDAPATEYSDEAWSRRVGNVTPQHVGRLRRVYERFGPVQDDYAGLFWSHFQAAIDWHDAEMWLEGAVQNEWSISQMRGQRNEAMGVPAEIESETDSADNELDDDGKNELAGTGTVEAVKSPGAATAERTSKSDQDDDSSDDDDAPFDDQGSESYDADSVASSQAAPAELVRPFANLPSLPADISDAFEAYKLCILRHKLGGWSEISRDDLLASLDALKELALAPAAE